MSDNPVIRLFQPYRASACASFGLLALRALCGFAFMNHGFMKIKAPFSWMGPDSTIPGVFLGLAALSEFGGGLAWILGLLTPLASFGIACTMAVAVYFHAIKFGDPFIPTAPGQSSYELAAIFFCVALTLMFAGPGKFSLDRLIFKEKDH